MMTVKNGIYKDVRLQDITADGKQRPSSRLRAGLQELKAQLTQLRYTGKVQPLIDTYVMEDPASVGYKKPIPAAIDSSEVEDTYFVHSFLTSHFSSCVSNIAVAESNKSYLKCRALEGRPAMSWSSWLQSGFAI